MANQPEYKKFYVSKKLGGHRYIEDPIRDLKNVQTTINESLQCVYQKIKTKAAYGFIIGVKNESEPRNILTNASQHKGKKWMLNVDFTDFFHSVTSQNIHETFKYGPFNFDDRLSKTLTKLTTYNGRLPMGAPTSPVLSNFETRLLDYDLLDFAHNNNCTYTRFADDLTFSSDNTLDNEILSQIRKISGLYGYKLNPAKTSFYGPNDIKYVTGLKVDDEVGLPENYYQDIVKEITKYKHVMEIQYKNGFRKTPWVIKYQQQIRGTIEFAGFVLGKKSVDYQQLVDEYDRATCPIFEEFEAVSWLDYNYQ